MKEWNEEKNIAEQEPERVEQDKTAFSEEEYKTERNRGKIFAFIGLSLMVIALSVFVLTYEVKVFPPNLAVRVCYSGFLVLGAGIAFNGLTMILVANIKLEKSKEIFVDCPNSSEQDGDFGKEENKSSIQGDSRNGN